MINNSYTQIGNEISMRSFISNHQSSDLSEVLPVNVLVLLEFQQSVDVLPPTAILAILPGGRIPDRALL